MNGTWVIAVREVRERARLFAICAFLATLPFVASLLPSAREQRADVIAVIGGFLSITVGLGLALSLGISTVSGELAERRMSFYFSRPVSAPAIWFGKALAALAISLGCFALISVPVYLVAPRAWRLHWMGEAEPLLVAAATIAGLFFISHFLSSIVRSRSVLLALDFGCAVVLTGGLFLVLRALLLGGAQDTARVILISIGVVAAATLVVGPAWQLAKGRTDLRRGHAALSRFVWLTLAGALAVAAAYVGWIVSFGPEDLRASEWIEQPQRGGSVLVSGRGVGRGEFVSTFLIDTKNGNDRRLPLSPWSRGTFSGDGQTLLTLDPQSVFDVGRLELYTTRVADGRRVASGIRVSLGATVCFSRDAKRVAVVEDRIASVFDVTDGRLLVSGPLDLRLRHAAFFLTDDVLRVIEYDMAGHSGLLRVLELDVRTHSLRKTGQQVTEGVRRERVTVSGDGTRMHFRGTGLILDGRTAEPVAPVPATVETTRGVMLHDGTFAVLSGSFAPYASKVSGPVRLHLFTRDGQLLRELAVPGVRTAFFAGEIEGGKLILIGSVDGGIFMDPTGKGRRMFVVDLQRGAIERTLADIRGPGGFHYPPILPRYAADQPLAAIDARGKLVTWDPRTGVVRRIPGT